MKEFFDDVSIKTKYIFSLSSLIILTLIIVSATFIYSNSGTNSHMLKILIFSEMLVILLIGKITHKLIISNSNYNSGFNITRDEISDGCMIFNTISEGIIVTDNKGRVRNINQRMCRILGAEENQVINRNIYSLLNELNYNNAGKSLLLMLVESLETQKEYRQREEMFVVDGESCYLAVSTYMLRGKSKNVIGVLAVAHDFTQKKKLEEHLLHVEKLATAGQMAAELAHEIKNPICSVKGLVQLMGKKHCLEGSKYYEIITNEINRISALTQGFLTLTQKRPVFTKTCISSIIDEIIPLIESNAEVKKIYIDVDMQKDIPMVNADRESIRQVIINIVLNGIDVLHENGKMNISIWYDQINELVKMEFKDNGDGIKPEYLDKIFEPFFTTKENGTGLGLAISRKIIEGHYGKLFAFNNYEGGATFVIELPAAARCATNDDKVS
ncbi:MAG: ATP-binding protein [Clostridiaceae bacterium]|nr:ATP-binding protein [Clostridiaceae bacterium]HQC71066.1 ATP-binding protein [Sedimentibacter sp.]HQO73175.1 ATP-binding protein [Sedimentibacter sp.]